MVSVMKLLEKLSERSMSQDLCDHSEFHTCTARKAPGPLPEAAASLGEAGPLDFERGPGSDPQTAPGRLQVLKLAGGSTLRSGEHPKSPVCGLVKEYT